MGAAGGWLEEYGSDFIIIGGCVSWRIGLMKFGNYIICIKYCLN